MFRLIFLLAPLLAASVHAAIPPADLLGVGSQMTFTRDIAFDRLRSVMFCDGRQVGIMGAIVGQRCCVIRLGLPIPRGNDVTLRGSVTRRVQATNWRRSKILIDVDSETTLTCRAHMISATYLRKAFGDSIRVDQVVTPVQFRRGNDAEL